MSSVQAPLGHPRTHTHTYVYLYIIDLYVYVMVDTLKWKLVSPWPTPDRYGIEAGVVEKGFAHTKQKSQDIIIIIMMIMTLDAACLIRSYGFSIDRSIEIHDILGRRSGGGVYTHSIDIAHVRRMSHKGDMK
jgi:hypothetical protein